ncbi:MAG: hypothetical protein R3E98_03485 [Gemmatimonadota bacterium]|nr:hypothetical protein [Gemmatimonadota bacterium]
MDPDARDAKAWVHFWILLALASVVFVLGTLFAPAGPRGARTALLRLPPFLFDIVPVAAGLVIGALPPRQIVARQALTLAFVASGLMLFMDSAVGPPSARALLNPTTEAASTPAAGAHRPDAGAPGSNTLWGFDDHTLIDTVGAAQAMIRVLGSNEASDADASASRIGLRDPRNVAVAAGRRLLSLSLPFILIGLAVGLSTWLHARVAFRREIDGRVAQLLIGWTFVPLVAFLLSAWANVTRFSALFEGAPLSILLVPYVPFAVAAAVGWKTSQRAAREMDP